MRVGMRLALALLAFCLLIAFPEVTKADERRDGATSPSGMNPGNDHHDRQELDPGDQYIAGDNRLFEVVRTEGTKCWCGLWKRWNCPM